MTTVLRYGVSHGDGVTVRIEYNATTRGPTLSRILTLKCRHTDPRDIQRSLRDALDRQPCAPFPKSVVEEVCARAASEGKRKTAPVEEPFQTDIGALYRNPEEALRNANLQTVPDFVAQEYKARMQEIYDKKAVVFGNPKYKHDVREEFKAPVEKSEWDDE